MSRVSIASLARRAEKRNAGPGPAVCGGGRSRGGGGFRSPEALAVRVGDGTSGQWQNAATI